MAPPTRPLQNRVAPTGEIVRDPARGLMMGNRGCLHGHGRELGTARWRSKLWICCVLRWKEVRRDVMPPGRWTALFFLDEATALAAGHRPCAYCRRADFLGYAFAWAAAVGLPPGQRPRAAGMDAVLHAERVRPTGRRRATAELPDGVMVRHGEGSALLVGGLLTPWSFAGYGEPVRPPATVDLLTPPSTVAALAAGYRPWLHPTVTVPHSLREMGRLSSPGG
jgi:hypothetical protein